MRAERRRADLKVGLTGGIASGKSTISRLLAGLRCVTIDADESVTRLYRRGGAGLQALVASTGRRFCNGWRDRSEEGR